MLSSEQITFVRKQLGRWLEIKREFDYTGDMPAYLNRRQAWDQVRADIDHSGLLIWLLEGNEPLPEPPPKEHGYPVYPDKT